MRMLLNKDFGGFSLTPEQEKKALEIGLAEVVTYEEEVTATFTIPGGTFVDVDEDKVRVHPDILALSLGDTQYIAEWPDGTHWQRHDYDGRESIIWSESPIHWA